MNTPKANTQNPSRRGIGSQGLDQPVKPSTDLSEPSGTRAGTDAPSETHFRGEGAGGRDDVEAF